MLKDITLGQFFPGESLVHRLDPRFKILLTAAYIVMIFMAKSPAGYGVLALFVALVIWNSKISVKIIAKSLRSIVFFVIFTAALNIFLTRGETVLWEWRFLSVTREGLVLAGYMILRVVFLLIGTSMLTYTTSPIMLTDGIERLLTPLKIIKFPAHELAMMMTIALRFIPTLIEETDKIMSAQKARGADFESGNIIKRAKALIPVLVPLFVSAFRRADELATAMECRCYRGGEGRTKYRVMRARFADFAILAGFALVFALVVVLGRLGI